MNLSSFAISWQTNSHTHIHTRVVADEFPNTHTRVVADEFPHTHTHTNYGTLWQNYSNLWQIYDKLWQISNKSMANYGKLCQIMANDGEFKA